ncbi:hypothetical protein SpCBS45565_g04369 [Spizellomyces sp. 'palustris']|nr:hypothetical protein SpCBS45565_g04369 [Spizellomyces sp. 'palustris']
MAAVPMDISEEKLTMSLDDIIKTTKKTGKNAPKRGRGGHSAGTAAEKLAKKKDALAASAKKQAVKSRRAAVNQRRGIRTGVSTKPQPPKPKFSAPQFVSKAIPPANVMISIVNDNVKTPSNGTRRRASKNGAPDYHASEVPQRNTTPVSRPRIAAKDIPSGPLSSRFAQMQRQRTNASAPISGIRKF